MSKDLRLNWVETLPEEMSKDSDKNRVETLPTEMSKDSDKSRVETLPTERFDIHLNEKQVMASMSNIHWTYKVLAMKKNCKESYAHSRPPKTIVWAVNDLKDLRKTGEIQDCVANSISDCVENQRPMLRGFFTKHKLLTIEVEKKVEEIELKKNITQRQ
jgi:hypothetical protein